MRSVTAVGAASSQHTWQDLPVLPSHPVKATASTATSGVPASGTGVGGVEASTGGGDFSGLCDEPPEDAPLPSEAEGGGGASV